MSVFLGKIRLLSGCPPDSVRVGSTCIDKYEASVWQTTNIALIQKIQLGTVRLADLNAAGAVQRGALTADYGGTGCLETGAGCGDLYAVSVAGVRPSANMTWFQAVAFARNAGKRLPSNGEWQAAALGTPDGAPCTTAATQTSVTGTPACVSASGASDLVGNVWEWVDAWVPQSLGNSSWGLLSNDQMWLNGAAAGTPEGPGALLRGGGFSSHALAGPLAVSGFQRPQESFPDVGLRGAR